MQRISRGGVQVLVLVLVLALSGCDVSVIGRLASKAAGVGKSVVPKVRWGTVAEAEEAAAVAARSAQTIENRAVVILTPYAEGISEDDLKLVIKVACEAKDLGGLVAAPTPDEISDYVAERIPGSYGLRSKAESLAEDLVTANSGGDVVTVLALFGLCEAAD